MNREDAFGEAVPVLLCGTQITNLSRMLGGELMREVDQKLGMMIMCDRHS
ncbi:MULTISPECIES: hypothetical protein [unclassified Microcoleus]